MKPPPPAAERSRKSDLGKKTKYIVQKPKDWFHDACQVVALLPLLTTRDASRWCSSRVWNVMCASVQVLFPQSSQLVQRRQTAKRGETALCRGRCGLSVCTGAPRLGLSAPSSTLSSPHRAAAYAPFILTHTHWRLPGRNGCAHTHAARCSHRPPVFTNSYTLREKRRKIGLNKEASGDRQTAPAPSLFKEGGGVDGRRRVVGWQTEREERGGT